jgi:hypothetical protein
MEQEILRFLQQSAGTVYSPKEIGKKVDRERFREEPNWARPFLLSLVAQRLIEVDESGYYFYPEKRHLGDPR